MCEFISMMNAEEAYGRRETPGTGTSPGATGGDTYNTLRCRYPRTRLVDPWRREEGSHRLMRIFRRHRRNCTERSRSTSRHSTCNKGNVKPSSNDEKICRSESLVRIRCSQQQYGLAKVDELFLAANVHFT